MSQFSTRKQELEHKLADLETSLRDLRQLLHEEILEAEQHEFIVEEVFESHAAGSPLRGTFSRF